MGSQARAERAYNKAWNKAGRFYGARGKPPPRANWNPVGQRPGGGKYYGFVGQDPDGKQHIGISKRLRKDLSRKKRDPRFRNANYTLLHEWAHSYQDPSVRLKRKLQEGGAEAFARDVGRKLYGSYPRSSYSNYLGGKVKKRKFYRRKQFGANYGLDPTTINYSPFG